MSKITHSITTYQAIRERILALEADIDDTTLADTLEGLTDLHEVIAAVVRSALLDETMAEGLKGHIQVLQYRLRRIAERASKRRLVARDAMVEVDVRKITAPDFTLSVRPGSAALVVTDEKVIPDPYWQPREPRLDRLGLIADALVAAVPYKIEIVLTDNGIQFADLPKNRSGPTALWRGHPFDRACQRHSIEHHLTKTNHPWTNGQVERMNRTIKEATVQRYHYDNHQQLRQHLDDFVAAYNFGRRLKTLKGLTPYEYICRIWTTQPERFNLNPLQQMPGLNTSWAILDAG